ncbi:Fumarate and nitrate reduction regulatory protein [Ralstonia edaphis]|uniref:Fumarate and nitrate reduction regulatory protein n=3 Tax=Pseudomonadota TaxID=1224 RepID=A0AB72XAY1_9RALS|nr:Fumarate and nitrate reduction regulatory protein [Ralstonia sp. LMG 6871]CAJ0743700.1 Fumarate and nitrate reduction regulatory protein [Ralstonia sp. LMG 6871]
MRHKNYSFHFLEIQSPPPVLTRIALTDQASRCSTCVLGQICLPVGMNSDDVRKMDDLVGERIRIKKGQSLYSLGEPLEAVYGIRFGTLKTHLTLEDGRHQITGFHLPGEIVGLDGIGDMRHVSDATALEDTEVCVVRYDELQQLSRRLPSLQHQFLRIMSKEISQDHLMLLTLGSMRAEERLAAFLLNLSKRSAQRGYSSTEFVLRMSREELGSYLGLKLETVSRLFSRFAEAGLIQIRQRHVKLIDLAGLRQVMSGQAA